MAGSAPRTVGTLAEGSGDTAVGVGAGYRLVRLCDDFSWECLQGVAAAVTAGHETVGALVGSRSSHDAESGGGDDGEDGRDLHFDGC